MPCEMGMGGSCDVSNEQFRKLQARVAELEQALCGACRTFMALAEGLGVPANVKDVVMADDLWAWWDKHTQQPGHDDG